MAKSKPYSIHLNGHEIPVMHFTEERFMRALYGLGNDFRPTLRTVLNEGGFTLPFGRSSSGKLRDNSQMLSFRYGTNAVREVGEYPPDVFLLTPGGLDAYEIKKGVPSPAGKYRALLGLFPAAHMLGGTTKASLTRRLNKALHEGSVKPSELLHWYSLAYQEPTWSGRTVKNFTDDAYHLKEQLEKPHSFQLLSLTSLNPFLRVNKGDEGEPGSLSLFERNIAKQASKKSTKFTPRLRAWAEWYLSEVESPDAETVRHLKKALGKRK